ncbi:MAG: U32 family peptidase [Thermodesulfobacteriota bacterium]
MELTLGPVLFDWKRADLLKFYDEVADMPLDRVYIGEVVCAKKKGLSPKDIERVGRMLEGAGKEVVVSTLAVVSNDEEVRLVSEMVSLPFVVEANDLSALNVAETTGKAEKIFAGPHITAYNAEGVEFLKSAGVGRVVFPVELPRESVKHNIEKTGIDAELFAHGKAPLAFSWRCYTSRAYGLGKSDCRYHCSAHPDGMEIKSLSGEPVFNVNGTSVLSARTYTLVEFVEDIKEVGVKALRVSPQYRDTGKVVDIFRERVDGGTGAEALLKLRAISGEEFCNGWYAGGAGKDYTGVKTAIGV